MPTCLAMFVMPECVMGLVEDQPDSSRCLRKLTPGTLLGGTVRGGGAGYWVVVGTGYW